MVNGKLLMYKKPGTRNNSNFDLIAINTQTQNKFHFDPDVINNPNAKQFQF